MKHAPISDQPALTYEDGLAIAARLYQQGRLSDAIQFCQQLLIKSPDHPDALHLMGIFLAGKGDYVSARNHVQKSIAIAPDIAAKHSNLGGILKRLGFIDEALARYRRAIALDPAFVDSHFNMACLHKDLEDFDAAALAFDKTLRLDPGHEKARYMLAAVTRQNLEQASDAFVTQIFDEHAAGFEANMKTGQSRIPELVFEAAENFVQGHAANSQPPFSKALDLGCGTGRAGQVFRDLTGTLHGVDLSPNMLKIAKSKGVYDALYQNNFVDFMAASREVYDLVLSVDAFLYMGPLEATFENVARILTPGGAFGFTVEYLEADAGDYALQPSCRHAQSEPYIRRLAAAHGFQVATCQHIEKLRYDIKGTLFWLVKS